MIDKKVTPELIDNDTPEWTDEMTERAKNPTPAVKAFVEMATRGPGRPKSEITKTHVTIRLDEDIIAAFKAQGKGWQTRVNETLRANLPK